ncbi:MAG: metallophosphoesterase family protein [Nitrososphaerales archaeon]
MHKFAHMADIHLGAHREPVLQRLEMAAFSKAMDRCIEEKVDFILICGDLFHIGVPDLGVVKEAVRKMKEVQDSGIPIYAIYGSHDYTPTGTTVIDILDTVGIIKNVVRGKITEGKLRLEFFVDPKTGAKLVGISARKIGLESRYYEILDLESLEKEEGFKIFAFHSGLTEFKPNYLSQMETTPISYLPKGFDYYAGGHVHDRSENSLTGYDRVVFPGPLFAGYARDIEQTAKGEKRGFYIVIFQDKVEKVDFVEIKPFDGVYLEYDASLKNSLQAQKDLTEKLTGLEVKDKVVVLKVRGELSGGKTSEINFSQIKRTLIGRGALYIHLNRFGLTSKEFAAVKVMGEDPRDIESRLLKENVGAVKLTHEALKGEKGASMAAELLRNLREEPKTNESKKNYEERMVEQAIETLQLSEVFE